MTQFITAKKCATRYAQTAIQCHQQGTIQCHQQGKVSYLSGIIGIQCHSHRCIQYRVTHI